MITIEQKRNQNLNITCYGMDLELETISERIVIEKQNIQSFISGSCKEAGLPDYVKENEELKATINEMKSH